MAVLGTPKRTALKTWKGAILSIRAWSNKFTGLGLRAMESGPSPAPVAPWHLAQVPWKSCLPERRLGHWDGATERWTSWITWAWVCRATVATFSGSALALIMPLKVWIRNWTSGEDFTSGKVWLNSATFLTNSNCSLYSGRLRTFP